jgi:hypothetical protein
MNTRHGDRQSMTVVRPDLKVEHDFVREQLPWYLAQPLDALSERRVHDHLAVCEDCQRAYGQEAAWVVALREAPVVELAPQAGLSAVLGRIEARERRLAGWRRWFAPWAALRNTRALAFATAIQAAAIVGLVVVLGVMIRRETAVQDYRTLSNAPPARATGVSQLRLVFDDRLTSIEIRQLLDGVGGQIVDGPGPRGIFTVSLPRTTVAGGDEAQSAVQWLRARPGVRLVEIVGR